MTTHPWCREKVMAYYYYKLFNYKYAHIIKPNVLNLNKDCFQYPAMNHDQEAHTGGQKFGRTKNCTQTEGNKTNE